MAPRPEAIELPFANKVRPGEWWAFQEDVKMRHRLDPSGRFAICGWRGVLWAGIAMRADEITFNQRSQLCPVCLVEMIAGVRP